MIKLHNVALLSINTHSPEASVKALRYSSKEIQFKNIKILSHRIPNNLTFDDAIEFCKIPKFNLREEYSDFTFKKLTNYVNADYVLMIHDDGFVINPHLWKDEFLNYDYIGAPWPGLPNQTEKRVGNGGFCIRSKKLLDFCTHLDVEPGHDDWTIGVTHNDYLKECGFKFAPVNLAMTFSLELPILECDFDLSKTFGFHGRHHPSTENMISLLNYMV